MNNILPPDYNKPPRPTASNVPFIILGVLLLIVLIGAGAYFGWKAISEFPPVGKIVKQVPLQNINQNTNSTTPSTPVVVPKKILKFSSYDELDQFLQEHDSAQTYTSYDSFNRPLTDGFGMNEEMKSLSPSVSVDNLGATVNQGLNFGTVVGWSTQSLGGY